MAQLFHVPACYSSLATVEEDGGVILSRVQVLATVGAREVTVVPAAKNQTKPNQTGGT